MDSLNILTEYLTKVKTKSRLIAKDTAIKLLDYLNTMKKLIKTLISSTLMVIQDMQLLLITVLQ